MVHSQGVLNEACESCGKSHRTEEAFARCATRQERKAERAIKKEKDIARRIEVSRKEAPEAFVRRLRNEGKNLTQIVGALRKDYPPPEFEKEYDLLIVSFMVAESTNWGSVPLETKAMMLLEKHFTGDYITLHPLELIRLPGVTPIYQVTGDDFRLERDDGYIDSDS